ncbi:MAG: YfbK domain-containing protein, partial [Candidatus Sericytochromatia bacterium]
GHKLVRIGLRAKAVKLQQLPPQNLVFLLDVSGSMDEPNKLPLLKRSLKLLVDQMREQDHVAIVVYAGAAGLVLPPTSGAKREQILDALDRLQAGGSTAGSAGIQLAYETAQKNFRKDANNRVILATDGDFNVGPSSDGELVRMIEEKRKAGIYLTVLGYGMGNYKDAKLEQLADKGNGNHAYIDSLLEARKVLVTEVGGTLQTIAKDVKLQLEFNPTKVASYRLIGYENRLLRNEDFDDDTKDAGELGAGTTVTALYEIVPGSGKGPDLRYQQTTVRPEAQGSNELLTVKLRYKPPTADTSKLLAQAVPDQPMAWSAVPTDFRFAAAVAGFGMQLRKSEFKGVWNMEDVIAQASQGIGDDAEGYRRAFLTLAQKAQKLSLPAGKPRPE